MVQCSQLFQSVIRLKSDSLLTDSNLMDISGLEQDTMEFLDILKLIRKIGIFSESFRIKKIAIFLRYFFIIFF